MRFYAFCRTTDDLGDESGSPQLALERLNRWQDEVEAFFRGSPPVHPVLVALRPTVERHSLAAEPFLDLIAANIQDQRVSEYRVWSELREYCTFSAASVGRVVLQIFGMNDPRAQELSDNVCIGLQLANHAQDVSRDARLGRTYLLQSEIEAGGIAGAVRGLVDRARDLLASGRTLETMAPRALRLQLALYRLGGLAICDAIAASGYQTHVSRPTVSAAKKIAVFARALLETANVPPARRDAEPA